YGFPIDLTVEIAEEAGLATDRAGFDTLMNNQRQRAKADAKLKKAGGVDLSLYSEFRASGTSVFTGYEELETEAKVIGLIVSGTTAVSAGAGEMVDVILDRTSFYAESGGQSPDAGIIVSDGFELEVLDVQKPVKGLISHRGIVRRGEITVGSSCLTVVDRSWRVGAAQAHSATHVVHAALRQVLGPTALQSGSYNKPGYMRLDFSWNSPLSQEAKTEIEEVSNLAIRADLAVSAQFMSLPEAKQWGAVALFGETYDESVRVVQIGGPWSRELCGGTHVSRSSQIGLVSITGESSVGSGSRRIEANVGLDAIASFNQERLLLHQIAEQLKVSPKQSAEKVGSLLGELKTAQKALLELQTSALQNQIPEILNHVQEIGAYSLVATEVSQIPSIDALRELALKVRDKAASNSVVALFAVVDQKPQVVIAVSKVATDKGANAGQLVKIACQILAGGGGGKADLAQGGGSEPRKVPEAIAAVKQSLS
ncbi:MAG: alanine--tRNA ligase-related protein, partial [Rhodoluna sp.]